MSAADPSWHSSSAGRGHLFQQYSVTLRIFTAVTWVLCSVTALFLFFVYIVTPRRSANFLPDLSVYWNSVRDFLSNGSMYDYISSRGYPFTYPPFAGIVLSPTGYIPFSWLTVIWSVLVLLGGFTFASVITPWIAQFLEAYWHPKLWRTTPALPLVTILTLISGPLLSNLTSGQISIFIVLLTMVDAARIVPPRYQGIAIGIAAAIKLTPLAFVPYLWLTNRRRSASVSMGTFVLCTGIGWLLVPRDSFRYWLTLIWHTDRADPHQSVGNLSISGMLTILGLAGGLEKAIWICLAVAIGGIAYFRARRADMAGAPMLGTAIVGAMSVCVSPLSWEHHAVWLLVVLVASPWRRIRLRWIAWLLIVLIVVAGLRPWTMAAFALTQSSRLGLMATLVLIKAQGLLALAVACFVPFRSIARDVRSQDGARGVAAPRPG